MREEKYNKIPFPTTSKDHPPWDYSYLTEPHHILMCLQSSKLKRNGAIIMIKIKEGEIRG